MANDINYQEAEKRIAQAARSGATALVLSHLNLTSLPASLGQLTSLTEIDRQNNQLTALPESLGQLASLTDINLDGNQLAVLPESLGQLTSLTVLCLRRNQLTSLPEWLGQLTSLTSLDLDYNKFTALPEWLGQLTSLTRLDLLGNQLTSLPESFGQLTSLTMLDLDDNQLTVIPESFGQLISLVGLDLRGNQLTTLPPEIDQLTALSTLDLSDNQLTMLPPEIGQLTLDSLFLHGNPNLGLPNEVLGLPRYKVHRESDRTTAKSILDYYFETRGEQGQALREIKLILVGRGEVGKSSMVDVLQRKKFVKNRKRTDGVAITPWEVKLSDGPAKVQMWDFGGQEIMHGTHQFFLTHRSLYVVMVDGRHDRAMQDAEYWLKLVRAFGGDSSVFIVMNRQKSDPFDLDRQYLADKYGVKLSHFFRTDCEKEERHYEGEEGDFSRSRANALGGGTLSGEMLGCEEPACGYEGSRRGLPFRRSIRGSLQGTSSVGRRRPAEVAESTGGPWDGREFSG